MVENNKFQYLKTLHIPELTILNATVNTFKYKKHAHEDFAIGITTNGFQCFHCNNEFIRSPKGSVIQINPNELHDGFAEDEKGYSYYMVYIPKLLFLDVVETYTSYSSKYFKFDKTIIKDDLTAARLLQFINEIKEAKAEKLVIEELFLQVIEATVQTNSNIIKDRKGNKKDSIVIKAMEYMHDNLNNKLNLDEICTNLSISK
jgi:hypothetical protein